MTKGELYVNCLKIMFENDSDELDSTNISENEDYKSKTVNMASSINRALSEIAKAEKFPKKVIIVPAFNGSVTDYYNKVTLSNYATDIYKIKKIIYELNDIYDSNIEIRQETNNKLILKNMSEGNYVITYSPSCTARITSDMNDTDELTIDGTELIPDYLLDIIPYYVKGDLYEEDEAEVALMSTNKFHKYLSEISNGLNETIKRVVSVFSQTD